MLGEKKYFCALNITVMKKIVLFAAMLIASVACSQSKAPKALVLYYSQTETTAKVAQEISNLLGADIEEIALVNPYDGTYQETIARSNEERQSGKLPVGGKNRPAFRCGAPQDDPRKKRAGPRSLR